jgi:5-methylcytosine-specific restriction endonuclease McrA
MVKGSKMSEESRLKMSKAHMGNKSRLGIKHREDVKLRMSKSHKGKPLSELHRKRIALGQIGRIHSKETRIKIAKSKYGNKYNLGKKLPYEKRLKMMGVNHRLWKGGYNPLPDRIRRLYEYRQWRSDVFTRDDWTCQICGHKGYVQVDHIKSFRTLLIEYKIQSIEEALKCSEIWDINNGRTLCAPCHKKTDTYGSKLVWKK